MISTFKKLVKMSPIATEKFINHCIGVYEILKNEGHSEDICNAGLYHSIYGTSNFNITVQSVERDRELIKKEIGEYAENLVYTMCTIPDRDKTILSGVNNFNNYINFYSDISKICRANLIELYNYKLTNSSFDNASEKSYYEFNIYRYNLLLSYLEKNINPFLVENKIENNVQVFDNVFPRHIHNNLQNYVQNSLYKCGHTSNKLGKYSDRSARFVSYLNKSDILNLLYNMGLFSCIQQIGKHLGQDIFIKACYIGHYDKTTFSDSHVDSYYPNTITILIYPNLYWEDEWAGDLKIYNDTPESNIDKVISFSAGRVVVLDSRIRHKVMPLSPVAESSRYSIAIKACFYSGLESLLIDEVDRTLALESLIHIPIG